MKLIVVLSRVPYPLDKGDKLRAYHQLKHLGKQHEIYLFCVSDKEIGFDVREHLLEFCKEVHVFRISKWQSYWSCFLCLFSTAPFQAKYFYSAVFHKQLLGAIKRVAPQHVFFQLIRTAEYARQIKGVCTTLDYMDAFSAGYKRMAEKSSGLQAWFYRMEASRLLPYEGEVFSWFTKHITISEQDKKMIQHSKAQQIKVVPNGVDVEYFTPHASTQKFDLIFHGNMSYFPNVDCALYVANEILPLLTKQERNVSFLISGSTPHPKIRALKNRKGIKVTGWLDDVRTTYSAAKIFIAPLQLGTGIQNKILEAMAMGIPCVISELAANALGLKHNEHVLIGHSVEEYCMHIESLFSNEALGKRLTEKALNNVHRNFQWSDTAQRLQLFLAADS